MWHIQHYKMTKRWGVVETLLTITLVLFLSAFVK